MGFWDAVASAGPYTNNLHLAPDRQPHQHLITHILQAWCSSWCPPNTVKAHTHTHPFNGPFPGLPRWAGTRKVKPIWILLKQETVSGSSISWAVCKSAPSSRQITMPAPHHSWFFTGRMPFLPPNQQRQSTEGNQHIKLNL